VEAQLNFLRRYFWSPKFYFFLILCCLNYEKMLKVIYKVFVLTYCCYLHMRLYIIFVNLLFLT
jgi:hypothetical protein